MHHIWLPTESHTLFATDHQRQVAHRPLIKHCVNKNLHKIIGGKGRQLPTHGGMRSSCTMKKEPIYF